MVRSHLQATKRKRAFLFILLYPISIILMYQLTSTLNCIRQLDKLDCSNAILTPSSRFPVILINYLSRYYTCTLYLLRDYQP